MSTLAIEDFRWGIEHEFPLIKDKKVFCDFTNLFFVELAQIIDKLPVYPKDYPYLRVGDLGIKTKRWYIEGFERFDKQGKFLYAVPKGLEIRTPVCSSLTEAVITLQQDINIWENLAKYFGYTTARVAFNPFLETEFIPDPPENNWEIEARAGTSEYLHMLTFGPDINLSCNKFGADKLVDIAKKLTFCSPFIVPFTFSAPFYQGKLWNGLSRRTYYRTGPRPAVTVFLADKSELVSSTPALTKLARVTSEVGRIEFKAFDHIFDLKLYEALGTLLLGIILDESIDGRLLVPDQTLHQKSAIYGFEDIGIRTGTKIIINAAKTALPTNLQEKLDPLQVMLAELSTPALNMIKEYNESKDIIEVISSKN